MRGSAKLCVREKRWEKAGKFSTAGLYSSHETVLTKVKHNRGSANFPDSNSNQELLLRFDFISTENLCPGAGYLSC